MLFGGFHGAQKHEVDDDPEVDYIFAGHLAYCGQTAAALQMLKIAIDRHYCSYPTVDKDPFFDPLRSNPQFQRLRLAGQTCHVDFVNDRIKGNSAKSEFEHQPGTLFDRPSLQ